IPKSTIGYYVVQIVRKSGIYMNWEEYKEQIHQYPDNILKVWTNGYCENNGKKNALASIAELYAAICALEKVNNEQDLIVFTDSIYIINCYNVKNPKKNFNLVNRLNDLLKERKGKSIFKHVRGHSGIYENEQADRLVYLGFQKIDVKKFNFPIRKQVLRLTCNTTIQKIKQVYKKLALLYHPNKNVKKSEKERQQAEQKFIEI
ncbi:35389_t:CDS:2, partial [Gigaspora margarita]